MLIRRKRSQLGFHRRFFFTLVVESPTIDKEVDRTLNILSIKVVFLFKVNSDIHNYLQSTLCTYMLRVTVCVSGVQSNMKKIPQFETNPVLTGPFQLDKGLGCKQISFKILLFASEIGIIVSRVVNCEKRV